MNELDLQRKCIEAVKVQLGGFAQKTSNRFLVGVPDLLFQIPECQTSFWEAKWSFLTSYRLEPTTKQKLWLRDFTRAGGLCGVIYFTNIGNDLAFAMRPTEDFSFEDVSTKWMISEKEFTLLPRGCKFVPFIARTVEIHDTHHNRR